MSRYPNDPYLSRYAVCIYWMSRYLERADNFARLLDVTQTFSLASLGEQNWQSVLTINSDEKAFAERYDAVNAANVIRFYLTDDSHPNSIYSSIQSARLNASQLRPVISTEMWVQINIMYGEMRALAERIITPQDLSGVLSGLRLHCKAHAGITHGGLYRDQGWYFYLIGRDIERADQTTRLLDIKYHLLLPSVADVGSMIDASQWFAVLRAASGYHSFRREHPYVISPATVAAFLLLDMRFPRSVAGCIGAVDEALAKLHNDYGLNQTATVIGLNHTLSEELRNGDISRIITSGLHEYLDQIQLHLIRMNDYIAANFF